MPEEERTFVQKWKDMHPGFAHQMWDERTITSLFGRQFPDLLEDWKNLPIMHQKIDTGKYAILYAMGGIATDTDTFPVRSVEPLFEELEETGADMVVGEIEMQSALMKVLANELDFSKSNINNGVIIARPGSEVLRALIQTAIERSKANLEFSTDSQRVAFIGGVSMFSKLVNSDAHRDSVIIKSSRAFEAQNFPMEEREKPDVFVVHKNRLSWVPEGFRKNIAGLKKSVVDLKELRKAQGLQVEEGDDAMEEAVVNTGFNYTVHLLFIGGAFAATFACYRFLGWRTTLAAVVAVGTVVMQVFVDARVVASKRDGSEEPLRDVAFDYIPHTDSSGSSDKSASSKESTSFTVMATLPAIACTVAFLALAIRKRWDERARVLMLGSISGLVFVSAVALYLLPLPNPGANRQLGFYNAMLDSFREDMSTTARTSVSILCLATALFNTALLWMLYALGMHTSPRALLLVLSSSVVFGAMAISKRTSYSFSVLAAIVTSTLLFVSLAKNQPLS